MMRAHVRAEILIKLAEIGSRKRLYDMLDASTNFASFSSTTSSQDFVTKASHETNG